MKIRDQEYILPRRPILHVSCLSCLVQELAGRDITPNYTSRSVVTSSIESVDQ